MEAEGDAGRTKSPRDKPLKTTKERRQSKRAPRAANKESITDSEEQRIYATGGFSSSGMFPAR